MAIELSHLNLNSRICWMKMYRSYTLEKAFWAILLLLAMAGCNSSYSFPDPIFKDTAPASYTTEIYVTSDSLYFPLDENTYNDIKSFNLFAEHGTEYISFYDRRSEAIVIYEFASRKIIRHISLKNIFKQQRAYKTSVFVKTFDSIFMTNQMTLYQLDGKGRIKRKIDFLEEPRYEWAYFDNVVPPVFKDGYLYTGIRPYVNGVSFKALRQWRVLYAFDLVRGEASLHYLLPKNYRENLYGDNFLAYNYCLNDRGNFVFNFPADTNIYETDLRETHFAYKAKSAFQANPITPVSKELLETDKGSLEYAFRHAYSSIYFDPYSKRYWRISKQKINLEEYKNRQRKLSIIILDEAMNVIGESELNEPIVINSIFFTPDGAIYARVEPQNEYAIKYIRLRYRERVHEPGKTGNT
ncbi:DUF4221 family protein [Chitinophaga filiformis]|uniref:DUF4221 domain-containing protein n=1 Tax=Chitinophaga filiformis TaxID=104663 RepID=A0ABY4I423_CHIFI|nr:DUF4221 family protein [Chitinophaga filiformis]UPK70630.1 DUF4221 domain-containing protein [Chitinophaga filiformis]